MTKSTEQYVCAFRGRRDSYQAPLALAEAGLLDQFITDAYATRLVEGVTRFASGAVRAKIASRSEAGIPRERVRCLWGTTLVEHLRHALGCAPVLTYNNLDRNFSWAAARRARKARASLFLYSPYAAEAFTARYRHTPRKVLFQYHPHPELEKRIMDADSRNHPGIGESFSVGSATEIPQNLAARERNAWKNADLILCASAFTKFSLVEAGADQAKCRVIPYGIDVPCATDAEFTPGEFRASFVGSGGQRKGLHHLLLAWKRAKLPPSSNLTLVCRVIDQGIERLLAETPGVELRRGASRRDVERLMASSALFVMPSLVEGFGQVYLEALAQGCPVLGTANTALPDLGGENDGVFLTTPGNLDELTAKLEQLSKTLATDFSIRNAARDCARRFSWSAFREELRNAIGAGTTPKNLQAFRILNP
jgi:glycosyltransferase involved in cell wall biosynthesis